MWEWCNFQAYARGFQMGVANRQCINAVPAWALCKFQSSRKFAGSARAFPCERGADQSRSPCCHARGVHAVTRAQFQGTMSSNKDPYTSASECGSGPSSRECGGVSGSTFPCERGADLQHDSCSRASVVLIVDMEAPQGLLQGR